jgi:hypothetical protein
VEENLRVPLKNTVAKQFKGREMNEAQYELAKRMGGLQPGYYIKQVIAILELGDVESLTPEAQENLRALHELLTEKLYSKKPVKRAKAKSAKV